MAVMKGAKGNALASKGKRSKPHEYVNNEKHSQPQSGLGLKRGTSAGTAKTKADRGRTGSRKA